MLSRRTNVLFTPTEHQALTALARTHDKTMGELIREAVRKTYQLPTQSSFTDSLARIQSLTKDVKTKNLDYRNLIVEGRKYD